MSSFIVHKVQSLWLSPIILSFCGQTVNLSPDEKVEMQVSLILSFPCKIIVSVQSGMHGDELFEEAQRGDPVTFPPPRPPPASAPVERRPERPTFVPSMDVLGRPQTIRPAVNNTDFGAENAYPPIQLMKNQQHVDFGCFTEFFPLL